MEDFFPSFRASECKLAARAKTRNPGETLHEANHIKIKEIIMVWIYSQCRIALLPYAGMTEVCVFSLMDEIIILLAFLTFRSLNISFVVTQK